MGFEKANLNKMNKLKFSYFILGIIFFVYAFIRVFSVGLTYTMKYDYNHVCSSKIH